ncbi:hemicentin-1-like isoform X2 [Danaus plexippus]|uniref:hemicentin-1-like isoform X2 n=1 Tax=Danaus plexippus TaxID=13037 RepID=UPI002AB096F4|nr:hemicentin-1-like isoform X2 [Danaus plexippus]
MLLLFISMVLFGFTNGHNAKSSLTFVIDDTGSMWNDIDQVKEKTNEVFDAVLNSNASKIDDFVLVTFNDPDAKVCTVTRDRKEFKKALSDITVDGGGDCPEYSMKGIQLALEHSKPNSLFYVFTDAASKDYEEYEKIKSLGLKKSIQVTFLLTGECTNTPEEAFTVYDKLAETTSGQVFHLDKQDVSKIIDYIIATIKNKKTTVAQKTFYNGYGNEFKFSIDSKLWDVMISVSADDPRFHLNGPDGESVNVKEFINTKKSSISKLDVKPGIYTMVLDNIGQTSVVITGSTYVCFQHGFSTVMPSTLNETSTKPIEDTPSYLAIELDNVNRDVILDTVEIRDINDNILSAYPLDLLNKDSQFYVTKPILTPDSTFKIAINGHTSTEEKITRIAPTAIEHQKPDLEGRKRKAPMVTILEGSTTTVEYDSNLSLKCKVHAFPKPDIVWKDDSGMIWPSKVVPVDLPYDYMGILDKDKINKNITLYCTAKNEIGEDKKSILVETKRNYFLEILESPKDLVIEYGSSSVLNFKVNAYPPATIGWYKKRKELFNDDDYEISADGSTLKIKYMHQGLRGFYSVKAMNEEEKKIIYFKIDMSGEKPEIDKTVSSYRIEKGSSANLTCRILKGKPEPEISWTFQNESPGSLKRLDVVGDFYIDKVGPENMGIYTCKARNEFGKDRHDIDLFVGYVPTIKNVQTEVLVPEGQQVILTCIVDGSPYPFVRWLLNDVEVTRTGKYSFNDNTLSFTGSIDDSGTYTCEASNSLGQTQKDYYVDIYIPVKMQVPKDTTLKLDVGSSTTLPCVAEGYPKPNIRWTYYSKNPSIRPKTLKFDDTGSYKLEHIQIEDEGFYRCSASNVGGLSSVTYEVFVRAPVSITNPDGVVFNAVKGDLALRIPCNAIGSPKPKVTWMANGEHIASASPAQPEVITDTILLEIGNSTYLECDLPHKAGDVVNWYKNGELIASDELYLSHVKFEDAGIYSCRVSTFLSAHTAHKKVTVGYKPRFLSDEETVIEYSEGDFSYMNCDADGYPKPSTQWIRNGDPVPINGSYLIIEMKLEDIGYYQCTVSNDLGSIRRTFKINSGECLLRTKHDFNDQQPLLLTLSRDWPEFRTSNEYVHIPIYKYFLLSCPGSSVIYNGETFGQNVKTKCSELKDKIEIKNRIIDYDKLKCTKKMKPLTKRTGISCFEQHGNNTELLQIGFFSRSKFLKVYDVCLDHEQKIPLFAKQTSNKGIALNAPPGDYTFVESKYLPFHFGDMYDCDSQLRFISSSIGKSIKSVKDVECCFTKRQLINPRDVLPGLSQVAVYSYLNVIPHWSTCGTKNWDELELRVRYLGKYSSNELTIFTGASDPMMLPGQTEDAYVSLRDRLNRRQPVPMYLWKIIQNPADNSSLAVIQLNIPNVTSAEAYSYMPCNDICPEVEWLRNNDWQDVNKGFTFCCSISDFNSRFGKLFDGCEKVFKTLPPLLPDFSLI